MLGDARLSLTHEPANAYDILLVDAFSSDSIPAHLLTVEAMHGYLSKIKPDGVIVMHLSNRNLDLNSPVAAVARAAQARRGAAAILPSAGRNRHFLVDTAEEAIIVARTPEGLGAVPER